MKLRLCTVFLFAASALFAAELQWEVVPKGRLNRLAISDPRELGMGLHFSGDSRIDAAIGNYFSLFGFKENSENPLAFHFGIEGGGFFNMRQEGAKFPLEHTDGLIGAYFEAKKGIWEYQLRFTHISSHLSDGSSNTAIVYSRETLSGRVGIVPNDALHVYAGLLHIVQTTPDVAPWGLQTGFSFFPPWRFSKFSPFVGGDLKWQEETENRLSLNLQLGLAINDRHTPYHSFRVFYGFYSGRDPRGQFFRQKQTAHTLGIEMQI